MHTQNHPQAGEVVKIKKGVFKGADYRIENWWDKLTGGSWKFADGNPACIEYALRSSGIQNADDKAPDFSDEVVYGKIGGLGKLMHVSMF